MWERRLKGSLPRGPVSCRCVLALGVLCGLAAGGVPVHAETASSLPGLSVVELPAPGGVAGSRTLPGGERRAGLPGWGADQGRIRGQGVRLRESRDPSHRDVSDQRQAASPERASPDHEPVDCEMLGFSLRGHGSAERLQNDPGDCR